MTDSTATHARAPGRAVKTTAGSTGGHLVPAHPFYEHPITPAHRRRLFDQSLGILAVRLPASLARLNPVNYYTPVLHDWFDWVDQFPGDTDQARWLATGTPTEAAGSTISRRITTSATSSAPR
ncbi:hypothetical protein OHB12_00440 [Nocardia sp. NBC_01730]|uniref:hypothetical protein n=1 Tax=Nocardia sp. NBC_01730 TaxID=2975998 RepID=UPI002E145D98|nr:hypothetical protein OHB12_00440 [Nocardia sp. NBC_01730]